MHLWITNSDLVNQYGSFHSRELLPVTVTLIKKPNKRLKKSESDIDRLDGGVGRGEGGGVTEH